MKKIFLLLSLLCFALYICGQNEQVVKKYKTYSANVIDDNFFQQLDSIIDNVYRMKYKYYVLNVWNKSRTCLDYIPTVSDSILYLSITGSETPKVYGNHKFYDVKYRKKNYFVGIGGDEILVRQHEKKEYELSRTIIKKNMNKDMNSPLILVEYKNKKLIVTADSRIDNI